MVEHNLAKVGVAGSTPVSRSSCRLSAFAALFDSPYPPFVGGSGGRVGAAHRDGSSRQRKKRPSGRLATTAASGEGPRHTMSVGRRAG